MLEQEPMIAAPTATARHEHAEQDLVQPGLQVGVTLVAAFERQRAERRLLQQVVGQLSIAAQLERAEPELRQELRQLLPHLTHRRSEEHTSELQSLAYL